MLFSIVRVDNLISQWQQMGVEAPHDTSLEDALTEVHNNCTLWLVQRRDL